MWCMPSLHQPQAALCSGYSSSLWEQLQLLDLSDRSWELRHWYPSATAEIQYYPHMVVRAVPCALQAGVMPLALAVGAALKQSVTRALFLSLHSTNKLLPSLPALPLW